MTLNDQVREFWEQEPCGTSPDVIGHATPNTREWFEKIEQHRYAAEPFIHAVAQFTRYHGQRLLEVGVGAGTDHLQWARAGAICHGVDLTDAAITTTRQHLACYGFESRLQRVDAERLPFDDRQFDVVYSWGVIHHAEKPDAIVAEIYRVLRPGGCFIGMVYHRPSLATLRLWARYGPLSGRPFRTRADVIWHHMESIGTKAYTLAEARQLFSPFAALRVEPILTPYDLQKWPRAVSRYFPQGWGWNLAIHGVR
jgi:ubiquinone/menaquinone biosynthesis C-methylase UbiE